jgi:nicotinamidase-related amidase
MSLKDSMLIIIDAQNEYADGKLAVANLASTHPIIKQLVKRYHAASGHIAHVWHITPTSCPVFTPGTSLVKVFPELMPVNQVEEVIMEKYFPDVFVETNLEELIEKVGMKKLVLVGYMVHICVSTTAREHQEKHTFRNCP